VDVRRRQAIAAPPWACGVRARERRERSAERYFRAIFGTDKRHQEVSGAIVLAGGWQGCCAGPGRHAAANGRRSHFWRLPPLQGTFHMNSARPRPTRTGTAGPRARSRRRCGGRAPTPQNSDTVAAFFLEWSDSAHSGSERAAHQSENAKAPAFAAFKRPQLPTPYYCVRRERSTRAGVECGTSSRSLPRLAPSESRSVEHAHARGAAPHAPSQPVAPRSCSAQPDSSPPRAPPVRRAFRPRPSRALGTEPPSLTLVRRFAHHGARAGHLQ
jgi:hypothetical protein